MMTRCAARGPPVRGRAVERPDERLMVTGPVGAITALVVAATSRRHPGQRRAEGGAEPARTGRERGDASARIHYGGLMAQQPQPVSRGWRRLTVASHRARNILL